jgi:hypothetical protein
MLLTGAYKGVLLPLAFSPNMSFPSTTQCISIAKTGGLEVIEKTAQPLNVSPDHIVIKVRLNFTNPKYKTLANPSMRLNTLV